MRQRLLDVLQGLVSKDRPLGPAWKKLSERPIFKQLCVDASL